MINNIQALEQQKDKLKKDVESIKEERDYLLDNLEDIKRACY
jgi:histidinol-phosphate/aromatic aminotransferase/cobyric acid decarboxylase-like protein